MWYKPKEKKPEGYAGVIVYSRYRNKLYEGNWDEDIEYVIIDGLLPTPLECFDAWCYRGELFNKTGLSELIHGKEN